MHAPRTTLISILPLLFTSGETEVDRHAYDTHTEREREREREREITIYSVEIIQVISLKADIYRN